MPPEPRLPVLAGPGHPRAIRVPPTAWGLCLRSLSSPPLSLLRFSPQICIPGTRNASFNGTHRPEDFPIFSLCFPFQFFLFGHLQSIHLPLSISFIQSFSLWSSFGQVGRLSFPKHLHGTCGDLSPRRSDSQNSHHCSFSQLLLSSSHLSTRIPAYSLS